MRKKLEIIADGFMWMLFTIVGFGACIGLCLSIGGPAIALAVLLVVVTILFVVVIIKEIADQLKYLRKNQETPQIAIKMPARPGKVVNALNSVGYKKYIDEFNKQSDVIIKNR